MNEWQPIETAPRDRCALLLTASGDMRIDLWGLYCKYNAPKFTHWMPLPDPPVDPGTLPPPA